MLAYTVSTREAIISQQKSLWWKRLGAGGAAWEGPRVFRERKEQEKVLGMLA